MRFRIFRLRFRRKPRRERRARVRRMSNQREYRPVSPSTAEAAAAMAGQPQSDWESSPGNRAPPHSLQRNRRIALLAFAAARPSPRSPATVAVQSIRYFYDRFCTPTIGGDQKSTVTPKKKQRFVGRRHIQHGFLG